MLPDPTSLPPYEGPPVNISGVEHLHLSFGTNAQTSSTSSRTGSSTVVTQSNFFARQMDHHGAGYWGFHFVLAFFATAIYELLAWLLFSSPR